jgi:hypothetical protein
VGRVEDTGVPVGLLPRQLSSSRTRLCASTPTVGRDHAHLRAGGDALAHDVVATHAHVAAGGCEQP